MILAACASLFALTSCEKAPEDLIVGTWNLTAINVKTGGVSMDIDPAEMGVMDMQYTFKADGTLTASVEGETITANYSVTEGEPATLSLIVEGETATITIKQLDKESLVLVQSEEDVEITMTFTRA